ncbi:MAG: hypothetical protein K0S44_2647 [Bacteroidetes bacterium]|jgi:hypothetical protein|nr:hypothetical protein [Bacteroidota bacterium]
MKKFSLSAFIFLLLCPGLYSQNSSAYNELTKQALNSYENKRFRNSAELYTKAFKANNWKAYRVDRYNAACAWTLAGNKDSAFYQLFKVADAFKYDNYDRISRDTVLTSLMKDPRWSQLLNIVRQNIGTEESLLNKGLLKLMDSVYKDDQTYRFRQISINREFGPDSPEGKNIKKIIHEKDSLNEFIVSDVLDRYGWLGKEVIGINGNTTLALVLQHSSLKTQIKHLPIMREAFKNKKTDGYDLAIVEDKVLLRQGKKQKYGSYLIGSGKKYTIAPIEDPANIDQTRAELGLVPFDEYLRNYGLRWEQKRYEDNLKELEHLTIIY